MTQRHFFDRRYCARQLVEKRSFCCFGRTFSAKEAEEVGFPRTCFLILHAIFNAYLAFATQSLGMHEGSFLARLKHLHYELQYHDMDFNRTARSPSRSRFLSRSRSRSQPKIHRLRSPGRYPKILTRLGKIGKAVIVPISNDILNSTRNFKNWNFKGLIFYIC